MSDLMFGFAIAILVSIAASLLRVLHGPTRADRMMGAQLLGSGGVGILLVVAAAAENWTILDVALVLALLAAFAAVAFVKSASPQGAADPETAEET